MYSKEHHGRDYTQLMNHSLPSKQTHKTVSRYD